jgi:hypothetical protein
LRCSRNPKFPANIPEGLIDSINNSEFSKAFIPETYETHSESYTDELVSRLLERFGNCQSFGTFLPGEEELKSELFIGRNLIFEKQKYDSIFLEFNVEDSNVAEAVIPMEIIETLIALMDDPEILARPI